MTPGEAITLAIAATPPTVCALPRIGAIRSTLSTPFCKVMRRVSGPTSGRACLAAFTVSHSLTANSTISTGPTRAGSSVTFGFGRYTIAVHALDLEAVFFDGVAMGAARNEEHVVPGRRHARAEIAADRARRHCRNFHCLAPSEWEQIIALI